MKHPEALLLPLMMFADYFLTVMGAIQREKRYARHFRTEHYELNPLWQKSIRQRKWFNLRHTALVIALNSVLIVMFEFADLPDDIIRGLLGTVIVLFGMILGRHISNLLLFRYLFKNPDQISGEVTLSHRLALATSLYQTVIVMVPVLLIAVFSRDSFAIGGLLGTVMFFCAHLGWIRRAKKRQTAVPESSARSSPASDRT